MKFILLFVFVQFFQQSKLSTSDSLPLLGTVIIVGILISLPAAALIRIAAYNIVSLFGKASTNSHFT